MTLEESRRVVRDLVSDCLRIAQIPHEAAAAMMGIPSKQLSKQLSPDSPDHLSMQRLMLIDDPAFWFVFIAKLRQKQQVADVSAPDVQHALTVLMASIGTAVEKQRRMAKASLPEGQQERRRSA